MANPEGLLQAARALGEAIASSKVLQNLQAVEKRIDADEAARKLRDAHREMAVKVARLEAEGKPVEPEQKRALAALIDQLRSNPLFQELLRCQVEYETLMRQVNEAIAGALRKQSQG